VSTPGGDHMVTVAQAHSVNHLFVFYSICFSASKDFFNVNLLNLFETMGNNRLL